MKLFPVEEISIPLLRAPALVVQELEATMVRTAWERLFRERLVGDAAEHAITMWRIRPFRRNDFAPRFRGQIRPGGRFLDGRFELSGFAKFVTGLWVATLLGLFLPVEITNTRRDGLTPEHREMLLIIGGMLVVGVAMPWLGWVFGAGDRERMTAVLRKAATGTGGA